MTIPSSGLTRPDHFQEFQVYAWRCAEFARALLFFERGRGAGGSGNSFRGHSKLTGMRECVNRKGQMM